MPTTRRWTISSGFKNSHMMRLMNKIDFCSGQTIKHNPGKLERASFAKLCFWKESFVLSYKMIMINLNRPTKEALCDTLNLSFVLLVFSETKEMYWGLFHIQWNCRFFIWMLWLLYPFLRVDNNVLFHHKRPIKHLIVFGGSCIRIQYRTCFPKYVQPFRRVNRHYESHTYEGFILQISCAENPIQSRFLLWERHIFPLIV